MLAHLLELVVERHSEDRLARVADRPDGGLLLVAVARRGSASRGGLLDGIGLHRFQGRVAVLCEENFV